MPPLRVEAGQAQTLGPALVVATAVVVAAMSRSPSALVVVVGGLCAGKWGRAPSSEHGALGQDWVFVPEYITALMIAQKLVTVTVPGKLMIGMA